MKRSLSILLLSCLLLALCACGGQAGAPASDGSTPDTGASGAQAGDTHSIVLVNASVNGEDHMVLTEEGHFLARAILPDRTRSVDRWMIDGEDVDSGGRRYSLEFDSAGAGVVSAILRERLNVSCDGCYLQFLDDNGTPGGPMYQKVYFEDKYVVPVTGNEHAGGNISCHISAKVPQGMKVDYWVINGTALRFDQNVLGFTLIGLTKTLEIQVVYTNGIGTAGADLLMQFEPDPRVTPDYPDDEPVILNDIDDGGFGWVLDDDGKDEEPGGTEVSNGGDGHTHDWVYDPAQSIPGSCTQNGTNVFKCSICGMTYTQTVPAGHQYRWVSDGEWCHYQECVRCGARGDFDECETIWVEDDSAPAGGYYYCPVCGFKFYPA
ncbi:MAG: hypothetical protein IK095_00110 [Oscillospiraceae bacterium]|nr:hypothetical protein [Oscillospiraceae bacterium]